MLVTKTIEGGSRIADRELAKLVTAATEGRLSVGNESVGQLLDQWLDHCDSLGRSPTTMRKYRHIADTVVRAELGHVKLSKLTARHLDRLYAKLTAKGNKATTVRRVHALISAALHQAERWNMVEQNVARRATPPPVHAEQIKAPSAEAVRAIIAEAESADHTLAVLLLLGAATGARRGELCGLRWSDVDWEGFNLAITRAIYEKEGGGWGEKATKTHQVRRVALDDFTLNVLRTYRSEVIDTASSLDLKIAEEAFMFSRDPRGIEPIRPEVVTRFAGRIAKDAGVDTHLHALRHFSATQLIAGGHDVRTVASRLGHADASVTLRVYAHALPEQDRKAAAALGRILASSRDEPDVPKALAAG